MRADGGGLSPVGPRMPPPQHPRKNVTCFRGIHIQTTHPRKSATHFPYIHISTTR